MSPTSKARREASRNQFKYKGGMPDRVKSFEKSIVERIVGESGLGWLTLGFRHFFLPSVYGCVNFDTPLCLPFLLHSSRVFCLQMLIKNADNVERGVFIVLKVVICLLAVI